MSVDVWAVVLMVLALSPLLELLDRGWQRRQAERAVRRLVEAGWAPPPDVHASAVLQVERERRLSALAAAVGGVAGVGIMLLAGAAREQVAWGWVVGMIVLSHLGRILVHLRAGRLRAGPRVVALRHRIVWDYLPGEDRAALLLQLAVLGGTVVILGVLTRQQPPDDLAPLMVVTGAAVWAVLVALATAVVTRSAMAGSTRDALRWQDVWRSVLVRDLAGLLGPAALLAVMSLWVATDVWAAPAWVGAATVVAVGATLLSMVLRWLGTPVVAPVGAQTQEG